MFQNTQIKLYSTLLLFLITFTSSNAQDAKYLEFSFGLKKYHARDQYQSPLTYKGLVINPGLGYSSTNGDWQKRDRLDILSGDLASNVVHKNVLGLGGLNFQSNRFTAVNEQSTTSTFLGISIKTSFASRSKGNRGQWEAVTSIAIVGAASYRKNPTDRWSHEAILSIPVFTWAVRPRFTTPTYILSKKKWKGPSHLFLTIPKFLGFDLQLNSLYQMDNGNALRFGYESQYYQILPLHPVRVFNHGIVTTAMMRVN